ncbi:hypothetical protein K439DRAFT_1624753 [Ramaria rubella]|nr:hypothetical protein K439DRAFT_1624753 [Ramaria rubella]
MPLTSRIVDDVHHLEQGRLPSGVMENLQQLVTIYANWGVIQGFQRLMTQFPILVRWDHVRHASGERVAPSGIPRQCQQEGIDYPFCFCTGNPFATDAECRARFSTVRLNSVTRQALKCLRLGGRGGCNYLATFLENIEFAHVSLTLQSYDVMLDIINNATGQQHGTRPANRPETFIRTSTFTRTARTSSSARTNFTSSCQPAMCGRESAGRESARRPYSIPAPNRDRSSSPARSPSPEGDQELLMGDPFDMYQNLNTDPHMLVFLYTPACFPHHPNLGGSLPPSTISNVFRAFDSPYGMHEAPFLYALGRNIMFQYCKYHFAGLDNYHRHLEMGNCCWNGGQPLP